MRERFMIQHLRRKDIDTQKYDTCIRNSVNSRIYALSSYLDIVADQWDALILDDYKAVMPLPWRNKYFIKYIYPPCWTQQLGVFSTQHFDSTLVDQFIKAIPKKFLKTTIQLNSDCKTSLKTVVKNNYILGLNRDYDSIKLKFNKNRKRVLKKNIKSGFSIQQNIKIKKIITLFEDNYSDEIKINRQDYLKLEKLASEKNLNPITVGFFDEEQNLISGSLFFKDEHRIYYVFSANNQKGNKIQGNTALLNHIIQNHSNTDYILDFEGSMLPGIASFFKSFGSELEIYSLYAKKF